MAIRDESRGDGCDPFLGLAAEEVHEEADAGEESQWYERFDGSGVPAGKECDAEGHHEGEQNAIVGVVAE